MSQTVQRATEIIELLAERPRPLSEVATHFRVHRSTVFRQLQTLEGAGFVVHRADGNYDIGTRIIAIAQQALDNLDLRRIAHDELRALQSRVGTTVHLAQLLERKVVYIDKVDGGGSVRMYSRIGLPVLPQATGVGKVILAALPEGRRDELLAGTEWTAFTSTTHTSRASLDVELAEIGARGWGVDDSEFEDFMNCIAAPISNSTGTVLGALSISSIKVVNDLDALKRHLPDLLATTERIARALG
ncbi:IclR family transcriptional regulator [Microterricola gilva]|uniref:IclR family transcriptional regulator n=1 Tax=Microterricola gilva TaxID=393267 RepID=A0A4V2GAD7_9MICO|nr:IclR family transcriptional regulator [Microterricola gilva]RZU63836.1 IclR family transcriptional regulator [Microterricola gilva]